MSTKLFIGLFEALLTKFEGRERKHTNFSLVDGRTGGVFASPSPLQKFSLPSSSSKLTSLLLILCEESRVFALSLDNIGPSWFSIISL